MRQKTLDDKRSTGREKDAAEKKIHSGTAARMERKKRRDLTINWGGGKWKIGMYWRMMEERLVNVNWEQGTRETPRQGKTVVTKGKRGKMGRG